LIEANVEYTLGEFTLRANIKVEGFTSLWGSNGAGKTTLLRIISGVYRVQKGFIQAGEVDMTGLPVERRRIVLVDSNTYIPHMKVREHIEWGKRVGKGSKHVNDVIKGAFGLEKEYFDLKVGALSLGNRARVSIATAFASGPRAVLIDDVLSSIDDKERVMNMIKVVGKEDGVDVLYTHQLRDDLPRLSDADYKMDNGVCIRVS
jgi:molybdate/tungstate transport system ATP-binding protein